MDCFHEAILMVDATKEGWRIMHMNQAAVRQTGDYPAPALASSQGELSLWASRARRAPSKLSAHQGVRYTKDRL